MTREIYFAGNNGGTVASLRVQYNTRMDTYARLSAISPLIRR